MSLRPKAVVLTPMAMFAYVSDLWVVAAARFRPTRNKRQNMHTDPISVNGLNSTLEENGLNRTVTSTDKVIVVNFPTALVYVLALGIPGNFLVCAVYAINMTTSTRVYMFALAVADLAVCICGIILATIRHNFISREVIGYLIYMSVAFSVFILSFVAVERLLAVRCSVLHGPGLGPRAGPARSPWAGPGRA